MGWTLWIILGGLSGGLAVGLGAFGAHGLKDRLDEGQLRVFDLASRYQMIHALALLAVGFLALRIDSLPVRVAGTAFAVGTVLFSGSLYALALAGERLPRWVGPMTPVGGLALIVGWWALAWAAWT